MWLSLTYSRYPCDFNTIVTKAITVTAHTIIPANTYHPNKVLNQCGSKLMIQSQDMIDSVTIKKTKNPADILKFFL